MHNRTRRSGFTLLELLVVIGIIVVLATLAISATFRIIDGQRQSNTETTIQNVYRSFNEAWAKVKSDASKETPSPAAYALSALPTGTQDSNRAKVIWQKWRLMEAFPLSFLECNFGDPAFPAIPVNPLYLPQKPLGNLVPIPAGSQKNLATYWKLLRKGWKNFPNSFAFPNSESGACLLMALSLNRGGATFLNPDSLGSNAVDSDGDGMKEVVDGWGTPLFFFRSPTPTNWPTNNLQGSAPSNTTTTGNYADPLDPTGTLINPNWLYATPPGRPQLTPNAMIVQSFFQLPFGNPFNFVVNPAGPDPQLATYAIPVIASAGPNGRYAQVANPTTIIGLGLTAGNMNIDTSFPNDANDNIYSFLLRTGGTGN